jgi:hypothetical protein
MIIPVLAGGSLQTAFDIAQPGDTVELEAGAVWLGNYTLQAKPSGLPITVRCASAYPSSAMIRTPNSLPALATQASTAGWRFIDITFLADASLGDIVHRDRACRTAA